jgi:UDP-N-acetylmuramate dehydrogenase
MNAGCFGSEFSDIIEEIHAIALSGEDIILKKTDIKFEYRNSNINENLIILGVLFNKTKKINSDKILNKINLLKSKKKRNQPSSIKTGGSTFKNPTNGTSLKAWELIKKYNCDILRFGKAKYSSKHCNFIDNTEKASSEEIEKLIKETQKKIFLQSGIKLELEIKII